MVSSQLIKNVLLVEDNPSYQYLMAIAFEENNIAHNLHIVSNGEETLLLLQQQQKYWNFPSPDLIILDLDLPRMDGQELLTIIKQDLKLKLIPVIVWTSSSLPKELLESYNLKANCYLSKSSNLDDFFAIVQTSLEFCLNSSQLPES